MCPKGNDPLLDCSEKYEKPKVQEQSICLFRSSTVALAGDFAIKYNDFYKGSYTTRPLSFDASVDDVTDALLSLPDHAINAVKVETLTYDQCATTADEKTALGSSGGHGWKISLEGNQVTGKQHHFELLTQACGDGCQPKLAGLTSHAHSVEISQPAQTEMYECSRRGVCDYDTGICECFQGFTDEDCSVQSNLA